MVRAESLEISYPRRLLDTLKIYGPRTLLQFLTSEIVGLFWFKFVKGSYSQMQEDLYIDGLLNRKRKGFYVDVGAFDPERFSNTKRFYIRGWRGINIEPDPRNIKKFQKERPRDINLNMGIGTRPRRAYFYRFLPDTLSTFSMKEAVKNKESGFRFVGKVKVAILSLSIVLEKYCKKGKIDLLSVDAEGTDLDVHRSNNWEKFRPRVICVETKRQEKIKRYLLAASYREAYNNKINSIFLDEK